MIRPHAEAVVDLDAVANNVTRLTRVAAGAALMVVVKADGYGHGMVPIARAARAAGASWLGVALLDEALALRASGDTGRLLCWLAVPGVDFGAVIAADVDVAASSTAQLDEIAAGAGRVQRRARVHLKVDTGLSRNGCPSQLWPQLVESAATWQRNGRVEVVGVWSHLACADEPDHPANAAQERVLDESLDVARAAGVTPQLVHLANSPATLTRPSSHRDLVRVGLATYGLSPAPDVGSAGDFGLRPAMTLRARLAAVRRVSDGAGVSYGHTHVTTQPTTLGLVPIGYAEGIAVSASNNAQVAVRGRRCPQVGRVCMDQFVVDLGAGGADDARAGDEVVVFGPGDDGEPTAQDWAAASGTIAYEVVTRLGGRLFRTHTGAGR